MQGESSFFFNGGQRGTDGLVYADTNSMMPLDSTALEKVSVDRQFNFILSSHSVVTVEGGRVVGT